MRKILMLSLTVLLGAVGLCLAQSEPKTLVTVSFAGYDKLIADIDMIGQLGGNAGMGKSLDMMLNIMTQGKGMAGLDIKRPWGAVLASDGRVATSYAFLPVNDLKPLVELVKTQTGKDVKAEDGVYQIPAGPKPMYVVQKGNWAYIADSRDQLGKVAADPAPMLGDLPKRYDLAIRASIKNLPKEYRDQLLMQLRAGAEAGMQQMPGEEADQYAIRQNVAKQAIEQLTTLVNDLDEVLLGWNVDAQTKTTYLDFELTAQTGTRLAGQLAKIKAGKTNFAGLLLPEAAVTASSVGSLGDADLAQAKAALAAVRASMAKELENQGLGEEELKLATALLGDLADVLEKTLETKKTNAGLALLLDPAAATLLAGVAIADGAKLEKAVGQLVDQLKKSDEAAESIKLDAETFQGIRLHTASVPTPEPALTPLVGDTLEIVLGIADDKLFFAAGRDAAKTLKKAIGQSKTDSGKEVPPLEIRLAAKPIAKFLAQVGDNQRVKDSALMLAGALEPAGDKDHITLTAKPIPQGVRLRLEVEEGLLKVLGSVGQMLSPAGRAVPGAGF